MNDLREAVKSHLNLSDESPTQQCWIDALSAARRGEILGWQLVPVEPSAAIIEASGYEWPPTARAVWAAQLTASAEEAKKGEG